MVEEVESLVLEASVVDDFSRTLDELSSELASIATQEEQVDPIEIDTHVAQALAELEAVDQKLRQIDRRDADIDLGVNEQVRDLRKQGMAAGGPDYDRLEQQLGDSNALNLRGDPVRDRNRVGRMGNMMDRRTPVLQLPETDVLPDLGDWRRRHQDRGAIQNIRDAIQDFSNLRLSMGMLMNMLASLVPLLGIFVGALPAAIAGLGGLAAAAVAAAGALLAVGGLGIGAMLFEGGELNVAEAQRNMRSLFDTFLEAFMPIMEALRPVAEAIFRNAEMVIRDLAVSARGLLDMTDSFIAGIQWISDVLAGATAEAIAFADAAMPVLSFIIGGIADIDWLGIFAGVIADTLPLLTDFAGFMMTILAGLYDLSLGFAQFANMILGATAVIFGIINALGPLGQMLGTFISLVLLAVTVSSLWSLAQTQVMTRVVALASTIYTNVLGSLYAYIGAQYGATAATLATAAALLTLLGIITFGVVPAITAITGMLPGMSSDVGSAADNMRRFANQSRRARVPSTDGVGNGSGVGYSSPTGGNTVVAPDKETGNAVSNTLRFSGKQSSTTDSSDVTNRQHSGGG